MNCNRAEDLFSDHYEELLAPIDAEALEQHRRACAACRASYESFALAIERLRSSEPAAMPPEYAAQVSAAVFAAHSPSTAAPARRWRRVAALVSSHAAALLLGGWGYWALQSRGSHDHSLAELAPPSQQRVDYPAEHPVAKPVAKPVESVIERVVERVVEAPVEVLVEKRVEVPIEIVREVVVEHIEYVDRPVPHPLQPDLDRQQALLVTLARALDESLRIARLASERRNAPTSRVDEQQLAVTDRLHVGPPVLEARAEAPMVVVREEGLVRIRTRGELGEVIPALIAAVDDPDAEVSAAARSHLRSLHALLAQEGAADARSPDVVAVDPNSTSDESASWWAKLSNGSRPTPTPEPTSRERWQSWWSRQAIARADTRAY